MNGCNNHAENFNSEHDDNSEQSILNALLDVERDQPPIQLDEGAEEMGESADEDEVMSICNSVKRKKALRKAPHAPKRFKSAYIYFIMDKMEELRSSAGESLKVTDMMKQLAGMWNSLPAEYKKQYEEIACTDKERWLNDLAHYTGPMQVPNRRQKKPAGAPKRAISAFLSFSQQMRPVLRDVHPGLKNSELSIVLADKWRAASEEEKRPHLERELRERGVYHDLMTRWKEGEREKELERVREKAVAAEECAAAAVAADSHQADSHRKAPDPLVTVSSRSSDLDRQSPDLLPLESLEEHELSDWDVDNLHHHLVDYVSFMDSESEMKEDNHFKRGGGEERAAPVGESSAADNKHAADPEKGPPGSVACGSNSDTYRYMHSFESFLDRSSSYYTAAPPFTRPADMQVEELDGEPCFSLSELFSPDYVPFSSMLLESKNSCTKGGEQNSGKSNSSSSWGKDPGPSEAAPVDKPKRKYTFINRNRRKSSKGDPPKDGVPPVQPAAPPPSSSNSNSSNNNNNNNAAEMFYHKNRLPLAPPLDLFMALNGGRNSKESNVAKNSTSSVQSQSMSTSGDASIQKAGNTANLHWLEQVRSTQQMLDMKKKKEQDMQRTHLPDVSTNSTLALNRGENNFSSQEAFLKRGGAGEREGGRGPGPHDYTTSRFPVAPPPYPATYRIPAGDLGPSKLSDEDYLDSLFPSSQTDAGLCISKEHHSFESIGQNSSSISYPPLVLHNKNSLYAQFDFDSFLLPSQDFQGGGSEQFKAVGGGAINTDRKDSHSNSSGSTTPATGASDLKPQPPVGALQRPTIQSDLHEFPPGSTPASFFDEKAEQQQLLSHLLMQEQEEHKQMQQKIAQRGAGKAVKSKSATRKEKEKQPKQQREFIGDPLAVSANRAAAHHMQGQSMQQQQHSHAYQYQQQQSHIYTQQQQQQQQQQQGPVQQQQEQPPYFQQHMTANPLGQLVGGWQYNPQAGKELNGLSYHLQTQQRPPSQAAVVSQQQRPPPAQSQSQSLPPAQVAALLCQDADSESASAAALPVSSSSSSSSSTSRKRNRSTKVTETLRDKSLQTLQGFGNCTADYDDLVYGSARDH